MNSPELQEQLSAMTEALGDTVQLEVTGEAEKIAALRALCRKLTPDRMDGFDAAVSKSLKVTSVWRISMEEVTGKAKLRRPG